MYYYYTQFDYQIYLWLSNIRISIPAILRLFKIGIATIMLFSLFFLFMLRNVNNFVKIILFIPILVYVLINDPTITYKCFLIINAFEKTKMSTFVSYIMEYNSKYSIYVILLYMLIPFYTLIAYCRKTRIIFKIQNSLVSLVHLAIVDIFIVFFYVTGPFKTMLMENVDLLGFPTQALNWTFYTVAQPVIVFLLLVILFITIYLKPFDNLTLITNRQIIKNSHILNENICLIFHSYKNTLFAIERLSHQGINLFSKNPPVAEENLNDIHTLSQNSLDSVTRKLNMLRNVNPVNHTININECIDKAIQRVSVGKKIKIIKKVDTDKLIVRGDFYHITECFVNLFENSVDALKIKNTKYPFIKVKIFSENNLICVEILDNGCGINKKDTAKIFKMFYSTKQSNENWGIGLNYIEKVLNLYSGRIYVKSKYGRFTWFQMVLPTYSKRRLELWKKSK